MKNLSTHDLLQRMLRWAWAALLVGVLFAGGYYLWKTHAVSGAEPGQESAATETVAPEKNPTLKRFLICKPDFSGYQQGTTLGMNEYAQSLAAFAASRFRTDDALMRYYSEVLSAYPKLDYRTFTLDMVRAMVAAWQYNGDMVMSVGSPEIRDEQLEHFADALGVKKDAPDALEQTQCILRDAVYKAVCAYVEDPAALDDAGVVLSRIDPASEEMFARQSVVAAEADAGILPDSAAKSQHPGKKALAVMFLLGFLLVEAVVVAFALLDDTIRSASDLEHNTDLSVLSAGKDAASAVAEAALRLAVRQAAPGMLAIAPIGTDPSCAKETAAQLTAAMKKTAELSGKPALGEGEAVVMEDVTAWNEMLAAAFGRSVILLVCREKTRCRDLKAASEILRGLEIPVAGAMIIEP